MDDLACKDQDTYTAASWYLRVYHSTYCRDAAMQRLCELKAAHAALSKLLRKFETEPNDMIEVSWIIRQFPDLLNEHQRTWVNALNDNLSTSTLRWIKEWFSGVWRCFLMPVLAAHCRSNQCLDLSPSIKWVRLFGKPEAVASSRVLYYAERHVMVGLEVKYNHSTSMLDIAEICRQEIDKNGILGDADGVKQRDRTYKIYDMNPIGPTSQLVSKDAIRDTLAGILVTMEFMHVIVDDYSSSESRDYVPVFRFMRDKMMSLRAVYELIRRVLPKCQLRTLEQAQRRFRRAEESSASHFDPRRSEKQKRHRKQRPKGSTMRPDSATLRR